MSRSGLSNPRWREKVFSVAAHDYQWLDVFLAAMVRAEWRPFEQRLVQGLACLAEAQTRQSWPDPERIDEVATAFRYDRDLLTTDETVAWLDRAGLTLDGWTDFLMRRLLLEDWSNEVDVLVRRHPLQTVDDGAFAAEGICLDVFDRWATALAGRAAVCAGALSAVGSRSPTNRHRVEDIRTGYWGWVEGLDGADLTRRLAHLTELESGFEEQALASRTPQALDSQLARNRLEWMRVDLERLSFDEADAAREAAWCVRQDGMTLSEVAIESRLAVRDTRDLLERLEPELRDAVLSASVDELIGPLPVGSRHEVAWVVGKAHADLSDPLVLARAEEAVVEQLVSKAILSHVRWVDRPRT